MNAITRIEATPKGLNLDAAEAYVEETRGVKSIVQLRPGLRQRGDGLALTGSAVRFRRRAVLIDDDQDLREVSRGDAS